MKASYIMMRAYGEPEAFPLCDAETRGLLGTLTKGRSAGEFSAITQSWRPWRAYAAMLLVTRHGSAGMTKADRIPTLTALSA
jgi:AraC family transcriptional regulator of adaptative response / DNA-3-methyladenine glycosylase II